MKKHWHVDVDDLRQYWDADWSAAELSERYGCSTTMIYSIASKYGFRRRESLRSQEPPPPSPEDETASHDSLTLSPWVAARAAEFRKQKEQRGEAVYSGVHLRTYSLRTLRAVAD